jgi:hypothetical protein
MVKPKDLMRFMPFLTDTFGKAELEFAAVIVILWHVDQNLDVWTPTSAETVVDWALKTELPLMVKLRHNPFFTPDFHGLKFEGYVDGWEKPFDDGVFSELGLAKLTIRAKVGEEQS